MKNLGTSLLLALTCATAPILAQSPDTFDLTTVGKDARWKISGRTTSIVDIKGKRALELAVVAEPDGDEWFHVRIVVERPKVTVFVNGATEPSLVVNELSDRTRGSIGLWVGEGSGGHFANLRVTKKAQ